MSGIFNPVFTANSRKQPLNNLTATALPTTSNNASEGYGVGSVWGWNFAGNQWDIWDLVAFSGTDAIWLPRYPFLPLAQQHVDATHTDTDTDETALYTYTLPRYFGRANDSLLVWKKWACTNDAVVKSDYTRFGGYVAEISHMTSNIGGDQIMLISGRNVVDEHIANYDLLLAGVGLPGGGSVRRTPAANFDASSASNRTLQVAAKFGTAGTGTKSITLESIFIAMIRATP